MNMSELLDLRNSKFLRIERPSYSVAVVYLSDSENNSDTKISFSEPTHFEFFLGRNFSKLVVVDDPSLLNKFVLDMYLDAATDHNMKIYRFLDEQDRVSLEIVAERFRIYAL